MKIIKGFKQKSISNIKLKVLRLSINDDYVKIDIGFTYSNNKKNILRITDDIILSSEATDYKFIKSIGVEVNTDVILKSKVDFKYFSLVFEPIAKGLEALIIKQNAKTEINIKITELPLI